MGNYLADIVNSDKQTLALYLQAIATIFIGILAWTAACSQNIIAEKNARKSLFKLRYENIYQEVSNLFDNGMKLLEEYEKIKNIDDMKKKLKDKKALKTSFRELQISFNNNMESVQFLIRPRDYDKIKSICDEYISLINDHINCEQDNYSYTRFYVIEHYKNHIKSASKILSSYFYHENESQISFYIYKTFKYIKKHWILFIEDYFPTYLEFFSSIMFAIACFLGLFYAYFEYAKEILKADIKRKEKKLYLKLKMKSEYLKRNRPWPL